MWVDIDDVRKEVKNLEREAEEELAGKDERDEDLLQFRLGKLFGYVKVEEMLVELEKGYGKQGEEHSRSLMEEQK